MTRAQHILCEIFEPSNDDRLSPPLYQTTQSMRFLPFQTFTTHLTLPTGQYEIIIKYNKYSHYLHILYLKDGTSRSLPVSQRDPLVIRQETQDIIKVFRYMTQMIVELNQNYDVRGLTFTGRTNQHSAMKLYDHFAQRLAQYFNGKIYTRNFILYKKYIIVLPRTHQ